MTTRVPESSHRDGQQRPGKGRSLAWALGAELLKIAKRPASKVLLALALGYLVLMRYVIPYSHYRSVVSGDIPSRVPPDMWLHPQLPAEVMRNIGETWVTEYGALAVVFGALLAGAEREWGTLKTVLVQGASTLRLSVAQAVAVVASCGVASLAFVGTALAAGSMVALAEGQAPTPPVLSELALGTGYGWLIGTAWATFGLMLATLLRSAAIGAALGVVWLYSEGLVLSLLTRFDSLEAASQWAPFMTSLSLALSFGPRGGTADTPMSGPGTGETLPLLLAAYAVVFLAVAALGLRRRDVVA